MKKLVRYCLVVASLTLFGLLPSCAKKTDVAIIPGAENHMKYLPLLQNKKVALVANQASLVKNEHLVDFLLKNGIDITKIFSPEHGFRGNVGAGEKIKNAKDEKTGLPIVSLYGKHFKPLPEEIKGIDVFVFDLQDTGVRFYTYISTLHYVMEVCAEQNIPLIVLDRPNPNGHYIDGPVLEMEHSSFVGMHPVPIVYGMSIGEYAQMINGEKWLKNGVQCKLKVIPCKNWKRTDFYRLPVKPSPNLPNSLSVALYPSLCFFEGTVVSAGRGTGHPFQCYGHPLLANGNFSYTPRSIPEASKHPKFKGKKCLGYDLRTIGIEEFRKKKKLDLSYLISAHKELSGKTDFFNSFFTKLAGTTNLRKQIEAGFSEKQIRGSWQKDILKFKKTRKKYLIYPDF